MIKKKYSTFISKF